jgi:signal transduction histidine kinase
MLDVEKMRRVFLNLIGNAIEAMPTGGKLVIRSEESNGGVKVVFSDTGTGITEDRMTQLWRPFSTTKAKGMGLGLPISKRIVEAHGGSVSVESQPGKGTNVTVTLPIKPKAE